MASGLVTTDRWAIARPFGTSTKSRETVRLLTEAFPSEVQAQQAEAYFDQESNTVTPTGSEARTFPTVQNAKRGSKQVRGKGETRT